MTKRQNIGSAEYQRIYKRCQIVALHVCGTPRKTIAWIVGRHPSIISNWISRSENGDDLCDRVRSGRPPLIADNTKIKIISFYCQRSPLPGCGSWSLRWAEKFLNQDSGLLDHTISRSTIQRILKNHSLRPHLNKYFLAITDPEFFPKMDHLVNLYFNQPEYLFCYDECTGLQAKSRLAPDLPPEENQPGKKEFQYRRHGTTDLLAFLNVKNGNVFGKCTLNHTTKTLCNIFREQVNFFPADVPLHYIMDNLNTHFHNDFCQTVANLSNVKYVPLKTGAQRRQWLQKEDKRIVIHFTPFHGSWLNMIEIWFGILNQRCLRNQSFQSVPSIQETIHSFIGTWNQWFAHPFTWTYTGEGLQEKAIARFSKLLLIESTQMDAGFLKKQLVLMKNIATTNHSKTHSPEWHKLCELLPEKSSYINSILEGEKKEKTREKASEALHQFYGILN